MHLEWLGVAVALPVVIGAGGVLAAIGLGLLPVVTAPLWWALGTASQKLQHAGDFLRRKGLLPNNLVTTFIGDTAILLCVYSVVFALYMAFRDNVLEALTAATALPCFCWMLFALLPHANWPVALMFLVRLLIFAGSVAVASARTITFASALPQVFAARSDNDLGIVVGCTVIHFSLDLLFLSTMRIGDDMEKRAAEAKRAD